MKMLNVYLIYDFIFHARQGLISINADCYKYLAVSSILFSIGNLVLLALYYSSPYSAPYFLAAPRANQREKMTRSEGMKERRKRNLHSWVKVDQAGRPLPPKTLGIFLAGLALKLILCVFTFNKSSGRFCLFW